MLHLLLDQNLSPLTTLFLRSLGYDVTDTRKLGLSKSEDTLILKRVKELDRVLMTFNGDFADITEIPLGSHPGIIRLKVIPQTEEILHPILEQHLYRHSRHNIACGRRVLARSKIRIERK